MFISFEGTEGSGKTTQIRAIQAALQAAGHSDILLTREPGGTDIGDQIRTILLDNLSNTAMQARTELLLFCASRAQLVHEVLRPHLEKGGIILCDRYTDSSLAYQGYGHGLPIPAVKQILDFATGGLKPDISIYLDISPEKGLERRRKGQLFGEDFNRLDALELQFHQRVYAGYQEIITAAPQRWIRIQADQPVTQVQQAIADALLPRLPQVKQDK